MFWHLHVAAAGKTLPLISPPKSIPDKAFSIKLVQTSETLRQ